MTSAPSVAAIWANVPSSITDSVPLSVILVSGTPPVAVSLTVTVPWPTGTAKVTVDDEVRLLGENQSVYIPLGAVHRMENPGKVNLELIEVQTGAYLGEDDIVRYEDVYAREERPGEGSS